MREITFPFPNIFFPLRVRIGIERFSQPSLQSFCSFSVLSFCCRRFCRDTCYGIGRINGTCSADKTDCTCHEETVNERQYALCIEDGFCRLGSEYVHQIKLNCHLSGKSLCCKFGTKKIADLKSQVLLPAEWLRDGRLPGIHRVGLRMHIAQERRSL